MERALGIDIGGTKTLVCVGDAQGRIHAERRFPTEVGRGPEDLTRRVAEIARDLEAEGGGPRPEGVGVSAPGPLSSERGVFLDPPNMPGWHGFAIAEHLQRALGDRPVSLMNDANAAAWAEWRWGAGRGTETMIFLTMSTGMGAGLVIGGRLHEGRDDMAGEVGHTRVAPDGPVGFARRGSLEGFCSGPGIEQLAVAHLTRARHQQRDSTLFRSGEGRDFRLVTMPEIGAAAEAGDALALEVFAEVGQRLGAWLGDLVDLLNPDAIVLGTIGRLHFERIAPQARRALDAVAHPAPAARVRLLPAGLGEGTAAAAALAAIYARR